MSRKRDKPYSSRHVPYSLPKRHRPPHSDAAEDLPDNSSAKFPATVVVSGLSLDCSLLDIRSRFQIYGSISRSTMHEGGVAYITFRSKVSADSAIAASADPSFGITLNSKQLQVRLSADPVLHRRGVSHEDNFVSFSLSKLVRAEVPLRRHGRGKKLEPTIVNPRSNNGASGLDVPFKGREMVAYDDIL